VVVVAVVVVVVVVGTGVFCGRGLSTGKQGVHWSVMLNVPYCIMPIVSAVRFLRQHDSQADHINESPLVCRAETE